MRNHIFTQVNCAFLLLILFPLGKTVQSGEPVVNAVLFFSPSCPHCQKVITEDLPPIIDKYGDQIFLLGISTYTEKGYELFSSAVRHFNIPKEQAGVPTLIIGETFLVGSYEISRLFPEIIEKGLVSGGVAWPDLPGLAQLLQDENIGESNEDNLKESGVEHNLDVDKEENISNSGVSQDEFEDGGLSQTEQSLAVTNNSGNSILTTNNLTTVERFMQDKTGNSITTIVLFAMVLSVIWLGVSLLRLNLTLNQWPNWVMPILLIIGIAVAIYMGYVEITSGEAACGPVGDCNTVQQSPYAHLFGIIPIGLLGVMGYIAIGFVWIFSIWGPQRWRNTSLCSLWGLSLFGMIFSIYLTFLEPFVIGATCAWCLTSSIVMTLVFWNSTAHIMQLDGLNQLKFIRQE